MKHYYCAACLKNFGPATFTACPLCDKPLNDITEAVKDKQRFLQETQDLVAQQAMQEAPKLPTQMRGISQFYSSGLPGWKHTAPHHGCTFKINPNPLSQTIRLEFSDTPYMNPFVDMDRKAITSLATYLVDYLEHTQEKQ